MSALRACCAPSAAAPLKAAPRAFLAGVRTGASVSETSLGLGMRAWPFRESLPRAPFPSAVAHRAVSSLSVLRCSQNANALSASFALTKYATSFMKRSTSDGAEPFRVGKRRAVTTSAAGEAAGESAGAQGGRSKGGDAGRDGPWMLVGLGNPGMKYEGTRHNVGFEVIDAIARAEGISLSAMQSKAVVGKGRISGCPVLLVKPQTFMNLSGESVGPLARFYKIPPERVVAIYDDMDLDVASMKLLAKGGHGGHNGMKSIMQHFQGSRNFPRLRFGIGRPPGRMEAKVYVLQKFSDRERDEVDVAIERAVDAVRLVAAEGMDKAVSTWNLPRRSSANTKA